MFTKVLQIRKMPQEYPKLPHWHVGSSTESDNTNVPFRKTDKQTCFFLAITRKHTLEKWNVFVKPDKQSETCFNFAMARKGARKRTDFDILHFQNRNEKLTNLTQNVIL